MGLEVNNKIAGWNHDFEDTWTFFDVSLCFLCNHTSPDFRKPMYNDTLIAWGLGLGVIRRSLKANLLPNGVSRGFVMI